MLPALSQGGIRATRRALIVICALGIVGLALPTLRWVTRTRFADPSGLFAAAADEASAGSSKEAVATQAARGDHRAIGVEVEYLPRPSKVEESLQQAIDVDFHELPLEECIAAIEKRAKILIHLDINALTEENIGLDQPITLKLHDSRLKAVLQRLLHPLHLEYVLDEDVLLITTAAKAGEKLILRWYPVWDLYPLSTGTVLSSGRKPRQSMGPAEIERDLDLIKMIVSTVEPDTWEDLSGPGSIVFVGEIRCLCIRQTLSIHDEVLKVLRLWREAKRLEQGGLDR